MKADLRSLAAASGLLVSLWLSGPAFAQKPGGILRMYHWDSPPSMSIHEEVTIATDLPMMGVFNNLVLFDQHVARNSLQSIVPELATSWSWSEDGVQLVFRLRQGVRWHDGQPFTARDVECTWNLLLGRTAEKLRTNPRKSWYQNVESVSADGDDVATFHLKRPQSALLAPLASGLSPVYPCHVPAHQMRLHPIGTGPFKFVEFKPNEYIKVTRNPEYWLPERPYLHGIEYTIIPNRSTAILAFVAGKFDMTFPFQVTVPLMKDVKRQMPQAICDLETTNVARSVIINHTVPAVRQPGYPAGNGPGVGPQGLHRHPQRGRGPGRRATTAAARRDVGAAARNLKDIARLRSRRREEPNVSPQADERAWLRAAQAAEGQGRGAQRSRIP